MLRAVPGCLEVVQISVTAHQQRRAAQVSGDDPQDFFGQW